MRRHLPRAFAIVLSIAALYAVPAQSCSGTHGKREGASNVIAIRNEAVEIRAVPVSVILTIQSARAIPSDAEVTLTLDDIRAPESPGLFYEVYLDPPPSAQRDTSSPAYVGNLGFYGGATQQQFRVTEHVARALKAKHDKVTLTFVPRGMGDRVPADARVRIGRISISL